MTVSPEVRAACLNLLEPGQVIQYVVQVSGLNGTTGARLEAYLVVSTQRISIISATKLTLTPQALYASYPRQTRLGPVEYADGYFIEFEGMILEFADQFTPVIRAADAELDGLMPVDPFPSL